MVGNAAERRGMKDRSIAIRNIYVMMAYAFRSIRSTGTSPIEGESFEHLHDLFAEILSRGVSRQVKRGLHRDYIRYEDQLTTVRGRINLTRTARVRATAAGAVICAFDEYEPDTPLNRALKSVTVLLIRHGTVTPARKDALRRLLPYLDAVTLVAPQSIRWNEFSFHRNNAGYRLLLGACELVVRGLLPTEKAGASKLDAWLCVEAMSSLYERFLREYYAFHHPELSPTARTIEWDYDEKTAVGAERLPTMRTDVTLRGGGRTLIIDTKYYAQSLQTGQFGNLSVHSANLYQLLAYVKNADIHQDGSVSGLLLYARTDAPNQPDLDINVQGNRIAAKTLDLNTPWSQIQDQLEAALQLLDPSSVVTSPGNT